MSLRSLRLGYATNSSSAHSIIFSSAAQTPDASLPTNTPIESLDEFSRDSFVFSTPRDKALYLLMDPALDLLSSHNRIAVLEILSRYGLQSLPAAVESFGTPFAETPNSMIRRMQQAGVPLRLWFDFLLSDDVAICGYNDNYDSPARPLLVRGLAAEIGAYDLRWKVDGKALVAYSPRTGVKLRWSREAYDKAGTPELVDIKITDFCPFSCEFCYQGSTKQGQHAPLERIEEIFDQMRDMGVFEVAIGGGEPAQHPQFARIIEAAHDREITFNFTCFGLDWLRKDDVIEALRKQRGFGIGISVHDSQDLVKVARAKQALTDQKVWPATIMGQTVIGATPIDVSQDLLEKCIEARTSLLLLGYKTTGRGADFRRSPVDEDGLRRLLDRAREAVLEADPEYGFQLSVDTAFLDAHGALLDEMEVPRVLRSSPEGKFSMYVDAVTDTVAPSSYARPEAFLPRGDIRAQFAGF